MKTKQSYMSQIVSVLFIFLFSFVIKAQTSKYSQLANELQFARAINDKWAEEVWLGGTYSNTDVDNRVLSTNFQHDGFFYRPNGHSQLRLHISKNKNVPDIGQFCFSKNR